MPRDGARKKRIRHLSRSTGLSYTASLRALDKRPELAGQLLWPGTWPEQFGRPIGIITHPVHLGPVVQGGARFNDQPIAIRLAYGPIRQPVALMITQRPLPGESASASQLPLELANFVTSHGAVDRPAMDPDPDLTPPQVFADRMHAAEALTAEDIYIDLGSRRVPASRLRLDGFEAIEFHHGTETIVYCGFQHRSDVVRFDVHPTPMT
jgi:hypothetical protein